MLYSLLRPLARIPAQPRTPRLVLDFTQGAVPDISCVRASGATRINHLGALESVTNNVPRFDHDLLTGVVRGLLIEEGRTNSTRNNTGVGAVVGTPGTLPTNWVITAAGLSIAVAGTGTDNGIDYVDLRFSGTSAGTQGVIDVDGLSSPAAANTQVWSGSCYLKRVGGSNSNISSFALAVQERSSGGALLASSSASFTPSADWQRVSITRTLNQASTAFAPLEIQLNYASGASLDITLRIGLPQMEQGAFASSVTRTSGAAATRAADQMTLNVFGNWFNSAEGTFFLEGIAPPGIATSVGQSPRLIEISDGTNSNRMIAVRNTGDSNFRFIVTSGGAAQADLVTGAFANNTLARFAFAYRGNDIAAVQGGAGVLADASATLPTVTQLRLGARTASDGFWNGTLRRLHYWSQRLPDALLQTLSV